MCQPASSSTSGVAFPAPRGLSRGGVSEDSGSTGASSPPPEASVEILRSPTPAPELDVGASEGSQLQNSLLATHEPETPLASASFSQTPTPALAVDSATRGVSGGCGESSGGSVELRGDTTERLLSSMCELAKLVVEMARQPPARRLDSASTVQEVLTAAVAPHRLPPQEADALVRLRDEDSRLQTRCEDAERDLANEVQFRTAAEVDSVRSIEDFYTIHDLRTEHEELAARIRELDIPVAEQIHGVQRLKDRCRSSDVDCAAAMRYVAQERERMKAGLTVHNAELAKLR
ncbi:hypothetical protein PHMEG_00019679 [Phytophthora megakarya]|uniref:Uncharacterized protein n=1 Tax=Phytophthora megakarya TaxID=4795 RepID=A0A225VQP1_9STRA|nr:hypothetical protein PHMEG_00019679 [Phytophthora megakarya]